MYANTLIPFLLSENPVEYKRIRKLPLSVICSYLTRLIVKKQQKDKERMAEMRFNASLHGVKKEDLDDSFGDLDVPEEKFDPELPPPPTSLFGMKPVKYMVDNKGRRWKENPRLRDFAAEQALKTQGSGLFQAEPIDLGKATQRLVDDNKV